ncbi:hypothetical protein BDR04DRAFT_1162938 [Suillus decipiens]|nr:hypothetical protein BDR04DRAFT_1162938 [Suillus decipiens]
MDLKYSLADPATSQLDFSTTKDYHDFEAAVGGPQVLADLTGSRAYERFTGPQIARIRRLKPAAYRDSARISLVSSFISSLFLGHIAPIEVSDASGMNLMNVLTCKWDDALLEACGGPELRAKIGPEPVVGGTILGRISQWWVERWGFNSDCIIAPFTGDNPATVVALSAPGDALLSLGTGTTLLLNIPPADSPPCFTTSPLISHPTTLDAQKPPPPKAWKGATGLPEFIIKVTHPDPIHASEVHFHLYTKSGNPLSRVRTSIIQAIFVHLMACFFGDQIIMSAQEWLADHVHLAIESSDYLATEMTKRALEEKKEQIQADTQRHMLAKEMQYKAARRRAQSDATEVPSSGDTLTKSFPSEIEFRGVRFNAVKTSHPRKEDPPCEIETEVLASAPSSPSGQRSPARTPEHDEFLCIGVWEKLRLFSRLSLVVRKASIDGGQEGDDSSEENEDPKIACDPVYSSCDARVLAGNEDAHLDAPQLLDLLSEKPVEGTCEVEDSEGTRKPDHFTEARSQCERFC